MRLKILLIFSTLWLCVGVGDMCAQTEIYISDESALREFATKVNNGTYVNVTAYLTADIALTIAWNPIGNTTKPFKGHFEGWGHKITNLSITGSSDYAGLFGYIDGGSVRDVGVESGSIKGGNYVGGICGCLGDTNGG